MRLIIHPLWDSPSVDATDLQHQAHRLMLQLLNKCRKRLPTILIDPESAGGKRVMDAVISASLNPKIDPHLRLAALTLLQKRMSVIDPTTPKRLFATQQEPRFAISPKFGLDLEALHAFEVALEKYILSTLPGRADADDPPALAQTRAGLLIALLITRMGQASVRVLAAALRDLHRKPSVAGHWAWIDVQVSTGSYASTETRRIHLDPNTLIAWILAAEVREHMPTAPLAARSNVVGKHYRKQAKEFFAAFLSQLGTLNCKRPIRNLDDLCRCQAQRLCVTTMPVIASYASGSIVSSSIETSTWHRTIGYEEAVDAAGNEEAIASSVLKDVSAKGVQAENSYAEQLAAGDLESEGPVAELREAMRLPRAQWGQAFDQLITKYEVSGKIATSAYVVSWMQYLTTQYRYKGKPLTDGTLRYYRGLISNRLLSCLPESLENLDAEDLQEAYEDLLSDRRSPQQGVRMRIALLAFDRFLRSRIPNFPQVHVPGFEAPGAYSISARIITPAEYEEGLRLIDSGRIVFASDRLRDQTRGFWILAYRFGLRRSELIGVRVSDFSGDVMRVRRNRARSLKTSNATRLIPLLALSRDEYRWIQAWVEGARASGSEYLFFDQEPDYSALASHPVIAKINLILLKVTGDPRAHPHNLRHSTGSNNILGMLGDDLGLAEHPCAEPWMIECIGAAKRLEGQISGALHARAARGAALSMLLGHGTEMVTYEHYIHTFDLLLFFASWSGRYGRRSSGAVEYPRRKEAAQIRAMLGLASTTRLQTSDLGVLMQIASSIRPGGVSLLEKSKPRSSGSEKDDSAVEKAPQEQMISLGDLLNGDTSGVTEGRPLLQAETDAAWSLIEHLGRAIHSDREGVRNWLNIWRAGLLKGYDWSSMRLPVAREFLAMTNALLPELQLEWLHVRKVGGKIKKQRVESAAIEGLNQGSVRVRVMEPRLQQAVGSKRSRLQSVVTWCLLRILTISF